ncbi:hypothetical protein BGZ81_008051 [Podila clonocystis]|nr:hypothetical protein BGZ81_008051 [Podila clonocystis]
MISSRSSIKSFKHSIPSPPQEPLPDIPVDQTAKTTIHQTTKVPINQTTKVAIDQTAKAPVDQTAKPQLAFTPEEIERLSKPKVLISGAGIGGLTLAILLQKGGIPYEGPGIASLLSQLGIYDEFVAIGKPQKKMNIYTEDLKLQFANDFSKIDRVGGSGYYSLSRPDFYDLLWRQVNTDNIHLGKRVLSFTQDDDGVTLKCADNWSHHGDILVGADGAYSAVRQHLYKLLKAESKLPSRDDVTLPYSCVCLVGQTTVLSTDEFPALKAENCDANSVLGVENMCTVIQFLTKETTKKNDSFRSSEWGPEAAEAMAKEVRDFKVPGGKDGQVLTMGDYIDRTPKDLIAKVMLEEIVFDTWYNGRVVLLGDACHKMNPCGAAGALTAMHDAAALANWISTLRLPSVKNLNKVFKEYRAERYPVAKEAFETSQIFTKMAGKTLMAVVVRSSMKHVPSWLWKRLLIKMSRARPQCSFLPLVEDKGEVKPLHQPSLHKTLAIRKEKEKTPVFGTGTGTGTATATATATAI